jgi:DNA ligase (NAD+)
MLASEFLNLLTKIDQNDLQSVKGLGEKLEKNVIEFQQSNRFKKLISELQKIEKQGIGITITTPKKPSTKQNLKDKIIVITGSFDKSRTELKELFEERGAKVTNSVTSSTDILIAGEKAGSKLTRAKSLNIKVIYDYENLLK